MVAIENVMSEIDIFISSPANFNPEGSVGMKVDNIKLQRCSSSSTFVQQCIHARAPP